MSSVTKFVSKSMMVLALVFGVLAIASTAAAQEGAAPAESDDDAFFGPTAGLALGAGLAIGLTGLATAIAQKDIGAAAVGAVAEDPANLGRAILFIAIPETIVIFGLLIAFQLAGAI